MQPRDSNWVVRFEGRDDRYRLLNMGNTYNNHIVCKVAGVSYEDRQQVLADIYHSSDRTTVVLEQKPNSFDKNAISVVAYISPKNKSGMVDVKRLHVGFLPKELAAILNPDFLSFQVQDWVIRGSRRLRGMQLLIGRKNKLGGSSDLDFGGAQDVPVDATHTEKKRPGLRFTSANEARKKLRAKKKVILKRKKGKWHPTKKLAK